MKKLFAAVLLLVSTAVFAQKAADWKTIYHATPPKINDLVHTKLDVHFDYDKAYMYGKAWITLHPHINPIDTLVLDAKGMYINNVALVKDGKNVPLKFTYADSMQLHIQLDKLYTSEENYTIYIDYVSRPNDLKEQGSQAITDAKGLYFINPKGKDKNKPIEIWTQGETEATSVWCPTIDHGNQKCTEEITMTVPAKYVTLSNGLLVNEKANNDGTRSDTWSMTKPHSPYLFFMAVGDFAVVKDKYKDKEVSYYVEHEFEPQARKIFGLTPEMITCFSTLLNYDFPWAKYAQITGRDYVSGAMENTTATLHSDYLQQNERQLTDGNKYEDYVSHELFHQWFGDLVTAESWSNITVNESFADYGETLWLNWKYGKDAGDAHIYKDAQSYLSSSLSTNKNLVRFYYADKEDVFDLVSYQKGGAILHMLHTYLGDSAFFKGLNLYLHTHQYGNAEAQDLRLAFEQVSGQDLNWFFNEWYYGAGHPMLDISYGYNAAKKMAYVYIKQKQDNNVFTMPMYIDVYNGSDKTRAQVWLRNRQDTFAFAAASKPDLINVDAEKTLIAEKQDYKTTAEYEFQYLHAGNYADKIEAIKYCSAHTKEPAAMSLLETALSDTFYDVRKKALKALEGENMSSSILGKIEAIATSDERRLNRAAAIDVLNTTKLKKYEDLYVKSVQDSSYSVAGAALEALYTIDTAKALELLPQLNKDAKGRLKQAIDPLLYLVQTDADFNHIYRSYQAADFETRLDGFDDFVNYLRNVKDVANFKKGVETAYNVRNMTGFAGKTYIKPMDAKFQELLKYKKGLKTKTSQAALDEEIAFLDKKIKENAKGK